MCFAPCYRSMVQNALEHHSLLSLFQCLRDQTCVVTSIRVKRLQCRCALFQVPEKESESESLAVHLCSVLQS